VKDEGHIPSEISTVEGQAGKIPMTKKKLYGTIPSKFYNTLAIPSKFSTLFLPDIKL
jgi:hypothetical protein